MAGGADPLEARGQSFLAWFVLSAIALVCSLGPFAIGVIVMACAARRAHVGLAEPAGRDTASA